MTRGYQNANCAGFRKKDKNMCGIATFTDCNDNVRFWKKIPYINSSEKFISECWNKKLNEIIDIKIWSFEYIPADFSTHSSHKQLQRFKINCTELQSMKSKLINKIFSHVISHDSFCMLGILGILYRSSCFQKCQKCMYWLHI